MYCKKKITHAALIQFPVIEGDIANNLETVERLLEDLEPPSDTLCVLPELWATGFAYDSFETLQDDLALLDKKVLSLAKRFNIFLAGSLPECIDGYKGRYYNTLKVCDCNRYYTPSRKMNLFPGEEVCFEKYIHSPALTITNGGCLGAFVCYDLRFPEISRSLTQQGADILICSAQWPAARIQHWRSLIVARAIENQIFIIGCNSVGRNNGTELGGHSMVVSPNGKILLELEEQSNARLTAIHWVEMEKCRENFRSFTTTTHLPSSEKILSAKACAENVARRSLVGQKIVVICLQKDLSCTEEREKIESKRQKCDFLVIALNCKAINRSPEDRFFTDTDSHCYAALSAVDAVVDLKGMSKGEVIQLFNNHPFTSL